MAVCRALQERGVTPVLVYAEIRDKPRQMFERAGIPVEVVNYRRGIFQYFRKMRRIFRKYRIDTVDIEFFRYFDLIHWLARFSGIRNIVFTESNSGMLRARSWRKALVRLRAALTVAPVRRLVAISEFVQRQMLELGMDRRKITVVHKGVDTARFRPDNGARQRLAGQYGIRADEFVIGTVCVLRPFKHVEVLLEACGLLAGRKLPFRLFIGGDGPLKRDLMTLSEKLGIADRVCWLGHLANPEEAMRGWDVFVLPSVGEAFGFVLTETMACGVPAIASRSGGIPEIVEHGRTGLLVPPMDPAAFADALGSLAGSPALRREMAVRCVERVGSSFSVETAVARTLAVYDSLWQL